MADTEHDALVKELNALAAMLLSDKVTPNIFPVAMKDAAATITTLAAENARLLAFASSLADRDDSIGDDARAALNHEGPPHDQQ